MMMGGVGLRRGGGRWRGFLLLTGSSEDETLSLVAALARWSLPCSFVCGTMMAFELGVMVGGTKH